VPVIIKEVSGRILAGEIASIYENGSMIKLEKVSLLEVVGFKQGLEPLYGYKSKSIKFAFIKVEDIVHWENLPDYLRK
jgi:hypothetical protein